MAINTRIINTYKQALQFAIYGAIGGSIGSLLSELFRRDGNISASRTELVITTGIWFGIIGGCLAIALLVASSQYLKKGFQFKIALSNGSWVGFLAGVIAGGIAQYLYGNSGSTLDRPSEFVRVICWGIAGGLLGLGLSFRIPNLGKLRGLGGGCVGGLIGGTLFVFLVVVSQISGIAGRMFGIAAIGFCIGLMIVIIESAFREAWLEIHYGPKEIRTVTLGPKPISIGSNSKTCTIYARNATPIAFRYQFTEGQILYEDVSVGTKSRLQPGTRQTIGNLSVVVCAANSLNKSTNNPVNNHLTAVNPDKSTSQAQAQFYLFIKRRKLALRNGIQFRATEISGLESLTSDDVVAEVNHNPKDLTILGLKNCSHRVWDVTLSNGEHKQIHTGRSIRIMNGTKIDFGLVKGEIRI